MSKKLKNIKTILIKPSNKYSIKSLTEILNLYYPIFNYLAVTFPILPYISKKTRGIAPAGNTPRIESRKYVFTC